MPSRRFKHIKRGSTYTEVGRGELQKSTSRELVEGDRLVAYRGDDGCLWFRHEDEFLDGRFQEIESDTARVASVAAVATELEEI
jgi:hypothetical protein